MFTLEAAFAMAQSITLLIKSIKGGDTKVVAEDGHVMTQEEVDAAFAKEEAAQSVASANIASRIEDAHKGD